MSISAATFTYLFLVLELLFYSSFAVSDTFGFTLASQRWEQRYWYPINSFGYRDVAHSPAEFDNRKVLFVVGDSFVAGHGISQVENRFSNILQRNLGEQYVVVNIAKNGWNTADEYQAILAYPYKPKKIILSYYLNDILGAAAQLGYGSPVRVERPPSRILRFVTDHSYSLNFTYWRLYRFYNTDLGEKYWEFLKNSYSKRDIWEAHQAELLKIVTYSKKEGIELTVVVFPHLRDVRGSAVITSQVADFLQLHNVRVLNLELTLRDRDPMTLVVNSLDAHPNEALNRELAEMLTKAIQSEDR
ncbi:MAG: SGNH/GDSL hydrolase family protein [Pyrinomonadaceae bacterium]|nr:SGNH/GDSL hydrolase family protein [Pyrinomonadaceae bacterium]